MLKLHNIRQASFVPKTRDQYFIEIPSREFGSAYYLLSNIRLRIVLLHCYLGGWYSHSKFNLLSKFRRGPVGTNRHRTIILLVTNLSKTNSSVLNTKFVCYSVQKLLRNLKYFEVPTVSEKYNKDLRKRCATLTLFVGSETILWV